MYLCDIWLFNVSVIASFLFVIPFLPNGARFSMRSDYTWLHRQLRARFRCVGDDIVHCARFRCLTDYIVHSGISADEHFRKFCHFDARFRCVLLIY